MAAPRSIGKQISTISRSLSMFMDAKAAHLGLGSATIPILAYLYDNEGVHQDVLAEALHFDKSSAARALTRLEKEGYITKKTDISNRRRNIIRTTEKARTAKQEIFHILKHITEQLFTGFSEDEVTQYFELNQKIHNNAAFMLRDIK